MQLLAYGPMHEFYFKRDILDKLLNKIVDNNLDIIEEFLNACISLDTDNNWPIRWASRRGHFQIVNRLLQDPRTRTWEKADSILQEEIKKIKLILLLDIPHDIILIILDDSPFRFEEIIEILNI